MPEVIIAKDRVVDQEDVQAQVSINANTTANQILSLTLRNNFRCFISFYGQAWDGALDTHVSHYLLVDGNIPHPRYKKSKVQTAPPEQAFNEQTPWFEVPQGSTIQAMADQDSGGSTGNVTARIKVYYVPIGG